MIASALITPVDLRTRLALSIGVSGHRAFDDEATTSAIRHTCVQVLVAIGRAMCAERARRHTNHLDETPIIRLISQLAQGTDRFVVHALEEAAAKSSATACTFEAQLAVVLPFSRDLYTEDFRSADEQPDPASIAEFDQLLQTAQGRVSVMPGSRADRNARLMAYEAAGRFVLDHSDLMIIVYDSRRTQSRGGTRQMYDEALHAGIPVVLIDPETPDRFKVVVNQGRSAVQDLNAIVTRILRLPSPDQSETDKSLELRVFQDSRVDRVERALSQVYQVPWRLLMWLSFLWRPGPDPEAEQAEDGQSGPPVGNPFDSIYRYAQTLAGRYAALHRGAFLLNYALGASAVTCALLALADPHRQAGWAVAELVVLTLALLNFWTSRSLYWRRRFIDWRFLTEKCRQMRVLHAIGMVPPTARPVILHSTGHPDNTWMDRCFRSWIRQIGPPTDDLILANWIDTIKRKWIEGQIQYHEGRAWRLEGAERMLHHLAYACFILAFIGCAGHLLHYVAPDLALSHWLDDRSVWLTVLAAGMPAWGAACHASSVQGEFLRLIERSRDVIKELTSAGVELRRVEGQAPVSISDLRAVTLNVAQLMLEEVTDWHIVHQGPEFIP